MFAVAIAVVAALSFRHLHRHCTRTQVNQLLQVLELLQTQLYGEGGGGGGDSEGGSEAGSRGGSRATSPNRRASACGSSGECSWGINTALTLLFMLIM